MEYDTTYSVISVIGSTTALNISILQKSAAFLCWLISLGFANIRILFLDHAQKLLLTGTGGPTESNSQWQSANPTVRSHTVRDYGKKHDQSIGEI